MTSRLSISGYWAESCNENHTLTTWRPQIPNRSFLNTVTYFENKENFADNIREEFTYGTLT